MNAAQRRSDLNRLLHYRRKNGFAFGPEIGWVEVIANLVRVLNGTVTTEVVHEEAKRLGLGKIDQHLVADVVADISARAWGKYKLFSPRLAGAKLQVTSVERDEAGIIKLDAVDETKEERRRRVDRERKAEKRAAEATLRTQSKPKSEIMAELAKELGISVSTLYRRLKKGDEKICVRMSITYGNNHRTEKFSPSMTEGGAA